MLAARLTALRCLRPALAGGRTLSTASFPVDPPISLFGIAGRYASALYTAAAKKGELVEVEKDLKLFKETMDASPVLKNFVSDPSISRSAKAAGISTILTAANASEVTKNLMGTMAEGGRMADVLKVMNLYSDLLTAAKGEARAVITSAEPLDAEELEELKKDMADMAKVDNLVTTVRIDPTLIKGVTIEIGDKFLDLSVATQLKKLQALLQNI